MRAKITALALSLIMAVTAGSSALATNLNHYNPNNEITTENNEENDSARDAIHRIMDRAEESFEKMDAKRKAAKQNKAEKVEQETVEETEVEETEAEETQPVETKPAETKPAATQPVETKPAATQPVETKPAATQPVETKPAATQPAETKPAATQPVETKPAATQPVETKPAATQPAETQPAATTQAPTTQAPVTSGLTADQQNRLTAHLTAAINNVRANAGAAGLNLDGSLVSVAAVRANEASVLWSHTRPDGSRGIDMIPSNKWRGENLSKVTLSGFDGSEAQIAALAQRITNNWVNSAGHYANLVKGEFTNIGLYTYVVDNGNSWTLYTAAMFSN